MAIGPAAGVRHDVVVTVGATCEAEGELWVPLRWEPSGHRRVLPGFEGVLELDGDPDGDGRGPVGLRIRGTYDVPLGAVGRFGDGVAGRRVARQTLGLLVGELAERLDELVLADAADPADYAVDVREGGVAGQTTVT
jgi:hypothetical protein